MRKYSNSSNAVRLLLEEKLELPMSVASGQMMRARNCRTRHRAVKQRPTIRGILVINNPNNLRKI
jgi:hypothetical protein